MAKSGGSRKAGRNSAKCKFYRDYGTRDVNKSNKLRKHLRTNINDVQAKNALKEL